MGLNLLPSIFKFPFVRPEEVGLPGTFAGNAFEVSARKAYKCYQVIHKSFFQSLIDFSLFIPRLFYCHHPRVFLYPTFKLLSVECWPPSLHQYGVINKTVTR